MKLLLLEYNDRQITAFKNKGIEVSYIGESISESYTLTEAMSNGVYSLYNGWLKKPNKDKINDDIDLEPELSEAIEAAEKCKTLEEINAALDNIYLSRQRALLSGGEYSKGNLIFKELKNEGIIKYLKDKKVNLENEEMSLE